MSYIIGHRGAAGLELENTMPSFEAAVKAGVRCIEFDVHQTQDGQYVVCHDATLGRVSDSNQAIKDVTLAELQAIPLHNGSHVPSLREVMDFARERTIATIVEYKGGEDLASLCALLDEYQDVPVTVASFNYEALGTIRKLCPKLPVYLGENRHPFDVVQKAHAMGAKGFDINYKLLNPLTYWMAQWYGLEIMAYTVNSNWAGWLVRALYPKVALCSDYPQRFMKP